MMWTHRVVRRMRGMDGKWFDYPTAMTFSSEKSAVKYAREFAESLRGSSGMIDVRTSGGKTTTTIRIRDNDDAGVRYLEAHKMVSLCVEAYRLARDGRWAEREEVVKTINDSCFGWRAHQVPYYTDEDIVSVGRAHERSDA